MFVNSSKIAFWVAQLFMVEGQDPLHFTGNSASVPNAIKFQYYLPVTDYQKPLTFQKSLWATRCLWLGINIDDLKKSPVKHSQILTHNYKP